MHLVKHWNDGDVETLNFSAASEEGNQFEKMKQVKWINSLLALSNLVMSEPFDNTPQCNATPNH